jgi:hypothetical protein
MGNKIPMEEIRDTKLGAEAKGRTTQTLPHPGIHSKKKKKKKKKTKTKTKHQTQTLLHIPARFC